MKNDGTRTDKLERLMLRIGFFSALFILPSFVYLGCLFYEYINFDDWMIQVAVRNELRRFDFINSLNLFAVESKHVQEVFNTMSTACQLEPRREADI